MQLNKRVAELETTVTELCALVEHYKELFKLAQHNRFGASSEKATAGYGQTSLFSVPASDMPVASPPRTEKISYERRKQVGKRQEDMSKLPLEIVEHEIPEAERVCPQCGEPLQQIGTETRDEIKIIPPQVIHVEHRRKVYKCAECDKNACNTPIVKAPVPEPVIKGSAASASAIAFIMTQKYLMHLPLYRIEQDFKRQGVFINRQNMANWCIQVCGDWFEPVYGRFKGKLLEHDVLSSDDTGVQVLREAGKTPQSKSSMWLYRTGGYTKTPVAFYEYQPGRSGEHPDNFLKGWSGFCHTDGYAGYHKIEKVTCVGCWAHVRRKFNDAFKIAKAPDSPSKTGLDYCDRLFALEREFAKMTPDERFKAREKLSKPLAEEFFAWAQAVSTPPGLAITRAVTYLLNQKEWLMNVYLDGRLELSNNRGERSIKPFVVGRKNWLFSTSVSGVKASAVAFSIIETAKENGLKPFEYIKFLLETLPNSKTSELECLMPWSPSLPAFCRMT
ncbi:MAG TPA: IS66 family transposase [Clostridiales bacterium]|nr:IS66 family transposase [Clostridiales bacterium]